MRVDVVAVLVVFCIAFTVSIRDSYGYLPRMQHGRRHHKNGGKQILRPERDFNKEVVGSTSRKRGRHNNNNYLLSSHTTPRHSGLMEEPIECCPSMTKAVEIRIAKTRDNKMVEVFYNESNPQVFYRTKCVEGVAGKPCLLVKDANHTSVCEQRHTYMYAIVRDYQPGNSRQDKSHDDWRLEHIRVESGCACVLVKR